MKTFTLRECSANTLTVARSFAVVIVLIYTVMCTSVWYTYASERNLPARSALHEVADFGLYNSSFYRKTLPEVLRHRCSSSSSLQSSQSDFPSLNSTIFAVLSHRSNALLRQSIRETWGSGQQVLFFTSYAESGDGGAGIAISAAEELALINESSRHRDLVFLNVVDTYSNLTLKTFYTIKWLSTYCLDREVPYDKNSSKLVVKTDDNVFFNVGLFREKFLNFLTVDEHRIYGNINHNAKVKRHFKYAVSVNDYRREYYPDFVGGPCYMVWLQPYSEFVLKQAAQMPNPLQLEDVFFTGIAATYFKYPLQHLPFIYTHYKLVVDRSEFKSRVLALHPLREPPQLYASAAAVENEWNLAIATMK